MKAKSPEIEVNSTADTDAVSEVLSDYAKHVNAGDLDSWLALWMEDGRQMAPNNVPKIGIADIVAELKPVFDTFNLKMVISTIEDVYVHGDLGFTRCSYNLFATPKEGGDTIPYEPDGKALTIYKRQADGSWKIWFDCFNSNLAPSADHSE